MDDGYHTILTHSGSQEGYKTKFYVDREIRLVLLSSLLEMIGKNGTKRGKRFKNEIFSAFKRNYLE